MRDQQEIEHDKDTAGKLHAERKTFKASLKKMRKDFREKVISDKKKKTPSRERRKIKNPWTAEAKTDYVRYRLPTNVVPGSLATAVVEHMAPPGCRVYHDDWNGRWLMSMGSLIKSRSWLKYGHSESAVVLLSKMWKRYQELYGVDECPVPGLMELGTSLEQQAGAANKSGSQPDASDPPEELYGLDKFDYDPKAKKAK